MPTMNIVPTIVMHPTDERAFTGAPQFGHAFAFVLTLFPHSLHSRSDTGSLLWKNTESVLLRSPIWDAEWLIGTQDSGCQDRDCGGSLPGSQRQDSPLFPLFGARVAPRGADFFVTSNVFGVRNRDRFGSGSTRMVVSFFRRKNNPAGGLTADPTGGKSQVQYGSGARSCQESSSESLPRFPEPLGFVLRSSSFALRLYQ